MTDKPLGEDQEPGLLVRWGTNYGSLKDKIQSSLPCETSNDRMQLLNIFESDCLKAMEAVGKDWLVSDFIALPVELVSRDTNEVVTAWRTVLLGPGQQPIAFCSKSALTFLDRTSKALRQMPPWDPPVKVRWTIVPCRGGITYSFHRYPMEETT